MSHTKEYTTGEKLTFDVYGHKITGKFVSIVDKVITVETIEDQTGVSDPGENTKVHESFMV